MTANICITCTHIIAAAIVFYMATLIICYPASLAYEKRHSKTVEQMGFGKLVYAESLEIKTNPASGKEDLQINRQIALEQ